MNEITTVGLDLAKNVFRCTPSMQRERRFCASSSGGRSCWHSSVDYRAAGGPSSPSVRGSAVLWVTRSARGELVEPADMRLRSVR